jgi:hypothetical protein
VISGWELDMVTWTPGSAATSQRKGVGEVSTGIVVMVVDMIVFFLLKKSKWIKECQISGSSEIIEISK